MPIGNRIITRGLGPSRGVPGRTSMVTYGFGGTLIEIVKKIVKAGQSGAKRALQELEEIIVSARLIRVNDKQPENQVSGFVRVKWDAAKKYAVSFAGQVSTKVKEAWEDVKVTINRIK